MKFTANCATEENRLLRLTQEWLSRNFNTKISVAISFSILYQIRRGGSKECVYELVDQTLFLGLRRLDHFLT